MTGRDTVQPLRSDRAGALGELAGEVVASGNCSGCGACALMDQGLRMRLDREGFARPVPVEIAPRPEPTAEEARQFARVCPGRQMVAARPAGSRRHPMLGPVVEIWEAWAVDPEVRHRGSSGGTLTALAAWLTETGEAAQVVGAAADPGCPSRTVSVTISTRAEALAAAGSRYAPVSNAAHPSALDPRGAVIGKPCEVAALRAAGADEGPAPLMLSFFCAGVPSQHATSTLVAELGLGSADEVTDLRYRGHGWPGEFTAVDRAGQVASTSYENSWGTHLGTALQWRCKICPDGVGESADITAGDYWRTDERGYPDFSDESGVSVLIARTARGRDVVERAVAAGVLAVRPVEADSVAAVQPFQVMRRSTLVGRVVGTRLAGRPVPRLRGFGLVRLGVRRLPTTLKTARGAYRRSRGWRAADVLATDRAGRS